MTNFNFLTYLYIGSLVHVVFGFSTQFLTTNYTLDDVQHADIVSCSGSSLTCPHYSGGCHIMDMDTHSTSYGSGYCNLAFICRSDKNCVVEGREDLFSENTHNYLTTQTYDAREGFEAIDGSYFVSSCQVDDIRNYSVSLENNQCQTDAHCYSGVCQNGICLSDPDHPTYYCYLDYPDTKKAPVVKCDVIDQLQCDNNKCSSNYCNYYKKNEMYTETEIDNEYPAKSTYYTVYVIIFIFFLFHVFTM